MIGDGQDVRTVGGAWGTADASTTLKVTHMLPQRDLAAADRWGGRLTVGGSVMAKSRGTRLWSRADSDQSPDFSMGMGPSLHLAIDPSVPAGKPISPPCRKEQPRGEIRPLSLRLSRPWPPAVPRFH